MSRHLLTNDYLKRRTASSVPTAEYERGVGWTFDTDDDVAVRVATQLFPEVRTTLPADVISRALETLDHLRPPLLSEKWWSADPEKARAILDWVPEALVGKLYPYQLTDLSFHVARMRQDGGAYNAWDRGLGKTLGAVVVGYALHADRIVVACPNSSKESVWRPEIEKWDLDGRWTGRVHNLHGSKTRRDRVLNEWDEEGGVLLVHYEAFRLVPWEHFRCDLLVVDEAHRLSNGGPGKSAPAFYKGMKKLKAAHRYALSGSVMINSPEDIFGAAHLLFPKVYKSRWKDWNDRFLHYIQSSFGRVLVGVRPQKLDELRNELAGWMTVRYKQDELAGLPERIDQDMYVDLSPEQRRVYDELALQFFADLPDGDTLVVGSVLAQLTKLRQVATGLDLLGEHMQDSSKIDAVVDIVRDNLPHKTVVFAWHRSTCDAIESRLEGLGVSCVKVHGDVRMTQRKVHLDAFKTDPRVKVLVATIKTLGESENLQVASDLVFVESSWTPSDMEQAGDRVYRIGQERRVTVTNILARDTVDVEKILPAVTSKAALRRMIMGAPNAK